MALGPCLFWIFRLLKPKKYTADDRFHGNGPYGGILTKKESIRTLGFTLPYNKYGYFQLCIINWKMIVSKIINPFRYGTYLNTVTGCSNWFGQTFFVLYYPSLQYQPQIKTDKNWCYKGTFSQFVPLFVVRLYFGAVFFEKVQGWRFNVVCVNWSKFKWLQIYLECFD